MWAWDLSKPEPLFSASSPAQAQAVDLEEDEKHGESWASARAPGVSSVL